MHPILEQVKSVLGDRIRIIKVDVDKYCGAQAVWQIKPNCWLRLIHSDDTDCADDVFTYESLKTNSLKKIMEMTIDTTNLCSRLQKKLFEPEGVYYPIWQAMQNDEELTAVVRSRQLHIYRNGKKLTKKQCKKNRYDDY